MKKLLSFTQKLLPAILITFTIFLNAAAKNFIDDKITGIVKDEKGEGIPGVSVSVKGTKNGTLTDAEGKFSLNASKGATLIITSIGFENQEVVVVNDIDLTITLKNSTFSLSEVAVVGTLLGGTYQDRNSCSCGCY
jgi:hypothetical protein